MAFYARVGRSARCPRRRGFGARRSEAATMSEYFDAAYRETPGWDVDAAQPAMIALLDDFPPASPVLDVGCGTGTLALALARGGLTVLGVDLSAAAIDMARAKAGAAEPEIAARVDF